MKLLSLATVSCATIILVLIACRKPTEAIRRLEYPRHIQFQLYTDKDFSEDNNNILFTLLIQNPNTNKVLWDSVLPVMKIKDIPDFAHKILTEKTVPADNRSLLKVGFQYSIESVGISWHFDSSKAVEPFKIVAFNFQ